MTKAFEIEPPLSQEDLQKITHLKKQFPEETFHLESSFMANEGVELEAVEQERNGAKPLSLPRENNPRILALIVELEKRGFVIR